MASRSLILIPVAAWFFAAALSYAHRKPEGLTTIELNANTDRIEIIHRLHVHDAELALAETLRQPQINLGTLEARAQLALYVEERFQIVDQTSGDAAELTLIGAELDGEYILVYQESDAPLPDDFALRNDVLRDAFPDHVNTVNITLGPEVRTLVFAGDDEWKDLPARQ